MKGILLRKCTKQHQALNKQWRPPKGRQFRLTWDTYYNMRCNSSKEDKDQAWLIEHYALSFCNSKKVESSTSGSYWKCVALTSRMWNRGGHKLSIFEWIEELLRQSMLHLHILHTWHWVQRPLCNCLESPPLTLERTGGCIYMGHLMICTKLWQVF